MPQVTMKTQLSVVRLATLAIALCILVPLAMAHEHDTYKIGNSYYLITVGSAQRTLRCRRNVLEWSSAYHKSRDRAAAAPLREQLRYSSVTGLQQTLKVELAAGDRKETLPLDPSDSAAGSYTAAFIPTVQTTYSYRFFGTINSSPVDLTFACVPGEVSETAEDNSQVNVSGTVTRIRKVGAFGCPAAR